MREQTHDCRAVFSALQSRGWLHRLLALEIGACAIGMIACRPAAPTHPTASVDTPSVVPAETAPTAPPAGSDAPSATHPDSIADDAGSMPASASDAGPPLSEVIAEPADEATYIFDQTKIRTYNLTIAPADLATLNRNPEAETYVPGMLEVEGKTYGPLGVRYKGSVGAWRPPCVLSPGNNLPKLGKCSIKIDFGMTDSNARFYGVEKLNLHSMNQDDSMLRERLAYTMFREMGVAAPRAMHARLLINGALEGLFIAVEDIDERFTHAHFGEGGKGNLYKEIWPMFDDPNMYIKALQNNSSAATPAGVQKMLDFKAAISSSAEAAETFLNRDYMMRYTAVDRVLINDDGAYHWWCEYGAQGNNTGPYGNHNYYWYEARSAHRMWLIPWDLDTSFDGLAENRIELQWNVAAPCMCMTNSQNTIEWPASCDPLTKYLIAWKTDYDAMVDAFIAGPFAAVPVDAKLSTWAAQIESAVIEAAGVNLAPTSTTWRVGVTQLKTTVGNARAHRGYAY